MQIRAFVPYLVASAWASSSACAWAADAPATRYALLAHGETHAELFRRALLPGAYGAVVADETYAPVYQSVQIAARDLNIAHDQVGFDMELAAWWRGELTATSSERPSDGDVQTANVGYRRGPLSFRIGRQHVAGGAARYARFDGLVVASELGAGFDVQVYAGLTVLPRWNQRLSFTYLGAAADSNLKDPALSTGTRDRSDYLLGGARLGFSSERVRAGLSLHEQHEALGLSRRTLTLEAVSPLLPSVSAGASGSAELEAERFSEARVWLDAAPARELDLSLEWLHTEPALFLSRQSVLSVFSDAEYDEGGGRGSLRITDRIALEGGGWAELYSGTKPGARAEVTLQVLTNRARTAFARVTYARVLTPDNGYHSLRSSLTERLLNRLSATLEAYAYLYDHAIRSYSASTVYSGTLEYRPSGAMGVLWGASLVHSPYANLDAQTQVRLAYDFDFVTVRGGR
ncbi:MAG: hypothetical protein ABW061_23805 [Polyangiaceae bacterium]